MVLEYAFNMHLLFVLQNSQALFTYVKGACERQGVCLNTPPMCINFFVCGMLKYLHVRWSICKRRGESSLYSAVGVGPFGLL